VKPFEKREDPEFHFGIWCAFNFQHYLLFALAIMSKMTASISSPSGVSITGTTEGSRHLSASEKMTRAVWIGRIFFVLMLCTVAGCLGYAANFFLTRSETELALTQFESIADRALTEASKIAFQRRLSALTMASIASEMNPYADDWPFVIVPGFERIVQNLLNASSGKDMGFAPFVTKEQQADWEDFAYDFFERTRTPEPFPPGTGTSSFGKGIWAINKSNDAPDHRYHDTAGATLYGSPNEIFTPILHTDEGANPLLLFNVHFEPVRGKSIDNMIDCSKQRATSKEYIDEHSCGIITSMIVCIICQRSFTFKLDKLSHFFLDRASSSMGAGKGQPLCSQSTRLLTTPL
jgi:hypothetical protein